MLVSPSSSVQIRTPDQRLRVFISSTIGELAPERVAAREAIERLKLTPVLFELGARSHAAADVYRAYLDQSHIFVGIYAQSYGWVAPGATMSGLEEEYHLAGARPSLIYIKESSEPREPRLQALLDTIKKDNTVSYQKFRTPEELAELLENDLAVLLTERFMREQAPPASAKVTTRLPVVRGPSIGREADIAALTDLLLQDNTGLVTIIGPGGNGKSRISLVVAQKVQDRFKDGAVFVPLASLKDPGLVAGAIASHLGVYDKGELAPLEVLKNVLFDKQMLLVLDNFEQLLPAADLLADLLGLCPGLKLLVTSRAPLHIRNEQVYPLEPLQSPPDDREATIDEMLAYPSVQLFVHRALEASPRLQLDEANVRAIAAICRKLDGIPLALELAAANTRLMSPASLIARMQKTLGLLDRGARDLPERQRTMRAAITWSHDLLDGATCALFRRLAVLNDPWTLDDAMHVTRVCTDVTDMIPLVEQLVDQGLLRTHARTDDGQSELRFSMLYVVREFALEQLQAIGEKHQCDQQHAEYFSALAAQMAANLMTADREAWLVKAEAAFADIRASFWYWQDRGDRPNSWKLIGDMQGFWGHTGMASEALAWSKAAGVTEDPNVTGLTDDLVGRAVAATGIVLCLSGSYERAPAYLRRSLPLLDASGQVQEKVVAMCYLGLAFVSSDHPDAIAVNEEAMDLAASCGNELFQLLSLCFLTEAYILKNDLRAARTKLEQARGLAESKWAVGALGMYHLQCANVHVLHGELPEAEALYRESIAAFDRLRMRPWSGWSLWGLANVRAQRGDMTGSREHFHACMDRGRNTGEMSMVISCVLGLSFIAFDKGALTEAARMMGASDKIAADIKYYYWSTIRQLQEKILAGLRKKMTREQLAAEMTIGRDFTQEQAIALALSV